MTLKVEGNDSEATTSGWVESQSDAVALFKKAAKLIGWEEEIDIDLSHDIDYEIDYETISKEWDSL